MAVRFIDGENNWGLFDLYIIYAVPRFFQILIHAARDKLKEYAN